MTAEVVLLEVVERADRTRQKPAPERAVGDVPDAQLANGRQELVLGVATPERVLGLKGRDRMDLVGSALGRGLGQAEVLDLALLDELGHRANGLLDRNLVVDTVLVSTPSRSSEPSQAWRT